MQNTSYPQETAKLEIQTYKRPKDIKALRETHISFTGSPQRHPYDAKKVILVADPYSANTRWASVSTLVSSTSGTTGVDDVITAAPGAATYLLGAWLGSHGFHNASEKLFRRAAIAVLLCLACINLVV